MMTEVCLWEVVVGMRMEKDGSPSLDTTERLRVPGGWLYRTTHFAARDVVRVDIRHVRLPIEAPHKQGPPRQRCRRAALKPIE